MAERKRGEAAAVRAADATDARLPVYDGPGGMLRKAFPHHWSFFLGELALYSLIVMARSGQLAAPNRAFCSSSGGT